MRGRPSCVDSHASKCVSKMTLALWERRHQLGKRYSGETKCKFWSPEIYTSLRACGLPTARYRGQKQPSD